jgi:hypothetical protein
VVAAVALVVAMTASAAGASAPAPWAQRVCTALGRWSARVEQVAPKAASSDPVVARASLSGSLAQSVIATDDLVRSLRAAGVPKVTHGREIAASFVATFTRARAQLAAAAKRANRLPTTDATAFAKGAARVERLLERTMTGVDAALAKAGKRYASTALDRALAGTAACSQAKS